MNPNLQNGDENPYDFIFRPDPGAPVITPKSGNKTKQIIIFLVLLIVLFIVIGVVLSVISASTKPKATEAISAEAYQTEILRIIDLSEKNISGSDLQQKTVTLNLVLLGDQKTLADAVKAKGLTATPVQLAQYKDTKRDDQLTQAQQTNRHDEVFEKMIDDLFKKYYQAIKSAESSATTQKEKTALTAIQKHIETIYETAGSSSSDSSSSSNSTQSSQSKSSDNIQN